VNLTHSPAHILYRHLVACEVVSAPDAGRDWPATYTSMPDAPDNVVCIYNTTGRHDGRLMGTGEVIEHPAIMCKVRAGRDADAYARASLIADILDKIKQAAVAIDGKNYTIESVSRPTPIIQLGQEEGGRRFAYTVNAYLTVREN
jgi:hypothetical protein